MDLEEENKRLKSILAKILPDKSGHYFICGEIGESDDNGLPDKLLICPAYGVSWFQVYERTDKTGGGP